LTIHAPTSLASTDSPTPTDRALRWTDYCLLIAYCTLLFGYVAISGRPLTLHEARLPECSREMLAHNNWLVPMDGDRPWLERPPFPHWVMLAVARVIGQHYDNEWSARIPCALMGLLIVLMVARMAAGWFGRGVGVISGLALASMYEFYTYATLAEDDIFLAFLVVAAIALFVRLEFFADPSVDDRRLGFVGARPWSVVGFFVLLGLTNLAKGPIVGAAVIVGTIGAFFLMPTLAARRGNLGIFFAWPAQERRRVRRYLWLWGWAGAVIIALGWHVFIHYRFRDPGEGYLANLRYDFVQTHEFDEPWWFYPPTLLGVGLPWTPAAIVALCLTARRAWRSRDRAVRFLWCWAIVPIIVLSLPHRKHHHYLVPSLAPWAILAALGVRPIAQHMFKGAAWSRRVGYGMLAYGLPGTIALVILAFFRKLAPTPEVRPQLESVAMLIVLWIACVWAFFRGLWKTDGRWLLASVLVGVGVGYSWKQTHLPDGTVADTQFLRQDVQRRVPPDHLLAIDGAIGPLDFFRVQYYLPSNALLLHNLSYLRSDRIQANDAYVVARVSDLGPLQSLGDVQILAQSLRKPQLNVPQLALFHLTFKPDMTRYPPPPVSPMQAMMRVPGPDCGRPLPEGP
jgi:4-amino-4-deoxy-L-arabinose transferase-like glycosyltransferase